MEDRVELLKHLLAGNDLAGAKVLVTQAKDHHGGELLVFTVLKAANATPELIDAALETFIATRKNKEHSYWVHSLSCFTKLLWERRLLPWIKRLNEIAFTGAIELRDDNCCVQLLKDFDQHSLWSDAPGDVGLTETNLAWLKVDKYTRYAKARVDASPFSNEADHLIWSLGQMESWQVLGWSMAGYEHWFIPLDDISSLITRLTVLGRDVTEFRAMVDARLHEQLVRYEAALLNLDESDHYRRKIEDDIKLTRKALKDLLPST